MNKEEKLAQLIQKRDALSKRILLLRRSLSPRGGGIVRARTGEFAGMSARAADFLNKSGIKTRAHLAAYLACEGQEGLRRLRGIGYSSIREIEAWLKRQP